MAWGDFDNGLLLTEYKLQTRVLLAQVCWSGRSTNFLEPHPFPGKMQLVLSALSASQEGNEDQKRKHTQLFKKKNYEELHKLKL